LANAGARSHWKAVVDAIFARQERIEAGEIPNDAALLCAKTFVSYHLMGSLVQSFAVQDGALVMAYRYNASQHSSNLNKLVGIIEGLLQKAKPAGANRLEMMMLSYQLTCQQTEYDSSAVLQNAFGLLLFKKSVCYGWAELYSQLLLQCGIDSIRVHGETLDGRAHGWVVAQIGDNWYHFDPTWDNSGRGKSLNYFAIPDTIRATKGLGAKLPIASTFDPFLPQAAPACTDGSFAAKFIIGIDYVVDVANHQIVYKLRTNGSRQTMSTVT